jgi:cellulose synthase (UDP-forming)
MQLSELRTIPAAKAARRAFTVGQSVQYVLLIIVWLAAIATFWQFWFTRNAITSPIAFTLMTLALGYETTLLPSIYLFFLGQMRRPEHIAAPSGLHVALVTLCVPSKESMAIIERQIKALTTVTYPHDSWLLDEENDPEVQRLCELYGVRHFSRRGIAAWNQPVPPFQAKTKAGNVNAWLFEHGKEYEFFVQLDIDHNPVPDYLDQTLGQFHDPEVAWVQAPSIYGNLESWTARGSAEQELVLQGPLQMGFYGFSRAPFIIGSHSTYRTSAMLKIGGMQPTRAEDHLDTVVLTQHGFHGVFIPKVIATGDGPETFETYLAQQFAWAYSMIQVLFSYAPGYLRHYTLRTALQFVFVQTWYISWSFSMLLLFVLPSWFVLTNQSMAAISLGQFLLHYVPLPLGALAIWWWSRQWFHPTSLRLSWRGIILHIARWPVVFWAFINVLFRIQRPYMITPKGESHAEARPYNLSAQSPYLLLIALCLLSSWGYLLWYGESATQGYLLFVIENAIFMLLVFWAALIQDLLALRHTGLRRWQTIRARVKPLLVGAVLLILVGMTSVRSAPLVLAATTWTSTNTAMAAQPPTHDTLPLVAASPVLAPTARPAVATPTLPPIDLAQRASARQAFVVNAQQSRFYGAYDPTGKLRDTDLGVEMIYTNFYPQSLADLGPQIRAIEERGRTPLVTVEPWPLVYLGYDRSTLLDDITAGRYDQYLEEIAATLNITQSPILVRPLHEMDIVGLYDWSGQPSAAYIAAYRHIYTVLQQGAPGNLLWIWSPAGNTNALQYYPGDQYVDYVAFTALSSQVFAQTGPVNTPQDFVATVGQRYDLLRTLGKPLLIAEAGISAQATQQNDWLGGMFRALDQYPLLRGIVYYNDFNAINALVPVPPDYSITSQQWSTAASNVP